MTEMATEIADAPPDAPKKPKRHARANKRPRAAVAPPKAADAFEGITPSDCPNACRPDRCVITNAGFCAHPHKGGLQARLQTPDNLRRYHAAKRALGKQKLMLAGDA